MSITTIEPVEVYEALDDGWSIIYQDSYCILNEPGYSNGYVSSTGHICKDRDEAIDLMQRIKYRQWLSERAELQITAKERDILLDWLNQAKVSLERYLRLARPKDMVEIQAMSEGLNAIGKAMTLIEGF